MCGLCNRIVGSMGRWDTNPVNKNGIHARPAAWMPPTCPWSRAKSMHPCVRDKVPGIHDPGHYQAPHFPALVYPVRQANGHRNSRVSVLASTAHSRVCSSSLCVYLLSLQCTESVKHDVHVSHRSVTVLRLNHITLLHANYVV